MLIPDITLDEALKRDYDMVVLPGGAQGAEHLNRDPRVHDLLIKMAANGKFTAAICAASKVLGAAGLLRGKRATGYPGILRAMNLTEVTVTENALVHDGKVITSRGPGTAIDLALALIETLAGTPKRDEVESQLVRDP